MAGRRLRRFRTSLTANLVAVVLLLGAVLWVAANVAVARAVETLSDQLTRRVMANTEARLEGFVTPITHALRELSLRAESGVFDGLDPAVLDPILTATLDALPQISSAMVGYEEGGEFMLLATDDGWASRILRPEESDGTVLRRAWSHGAEPPPGERVDLDYDPVTRPWHVGARERASRVGTDAPFEDRLFWTTPYRFFTTQEPGITVSVLVPTTSGRRAIVAIDLLLTDISRFTMGLTEGRRAKAFVLRGDPADPVGVAVLGLPADPRFDDPESVERTVLRSAEELGGPVRDFLASRADVASEVYAFTSGGEVWWGAIEPSAVPLSEGVWVGSIVPEVELQRDVPDLRTVVAAVTLLLVLAAALRARRLARIYAAPIAELVHRGERLQRLDFRAPGETETTIREIRQLATTLESARGTLEAFHAEPEDARVARSVRGMLLPGEIASPAGWSIAVWHEAAPDVEGELADVVAAEDGTLALLLADLPGSGVAAAVDGAQLRAAFRAGVGDTTDLARLADTVTRFATRDLGRPTPRAWLGRLDPATGRLTARDLGLAPASAGVAWEGGDAGRADEDARGGVGDGVCDGTRGTERVTILPPGGALVLASDGVVDALDDEQQRFGEAGLARVIGSGAASATETLDALRDALHGYAADTARDRTALCVVRRG